MNALCNLKKNASIELTFEQSTIRLSHTYLIILIKNDILHYLISFYNPLGTPAYELNKPADHIFPYLFHCYLHLPNDSQQCQMMIYLWHKRVPPLNAIGIKSKERPRFFVKIIEILPRKANEPPLFSAWFFLLVLSLIDKRTNKNNIASYRSTMTGKEYEMSRTNNSRFCGIGRSTKKYTSIS